MHCILLQAQLHRTFPGHEYNSSASTDIMTTLCLMCYKLLHTLLLLTWCRSNGKNDVKDWRAAVLGPYMLIGCYRDSRA